MLFKNIFIRNKNIKNKNSTKVLDKSRRLFRVKHVGNVKETVPRPIHLVHFHILTYCFFKTDNIIFLFHFTRYHILN